MARNLTSIIIGISFHCPQDYSKVPRDLPWSSYLKRALSSSAPTTHCEYVSASSPGGPLVDRRLCASMPPFKPVVQAVLEEVLSYTSALSELW